LHTWGTVDGTVGSLITLFDRLGTGIRVAKNFDGAATYTDHTAEARLNGGTPFTLLLDSGDKFYLGFDAKAAGVRIDIATAATVMGALTWEYWNGVAWTTLSVSDGTTGLTVDGNVTWTAPADWATTTVDGVLSLYVRFGCASGPTVAPTANFIVVNWVIYDAAAGTNAKVYASPGEDGTKAYYLYLEDNGAAAHTDAKTGAAIMYESWDAVGHTGTAPCPTGAQMTGGGWVRKSTSLDATARTVLAGVDRNYAFLAIYSGDTASKAVCHRLGGIVSTVGSDAYDGAVFVPSSAALFRKSLEWGFWSAAFAGNFIQRRYDGTGASVQFGKASPAGSSAAALPYPNTADGRLYTAPFQVVESATAVYRGTWSPEVLATLHSATLVDANTYTDPDTGYAYRIIAANIDGLGFDSAPLFIVIRNVP
jgi:hypothetical protein